MESIGKTLANVAPVVAVEVAQEEGFTAEMAMELMVAEESGIEFPVDFELAWAWLGYSRKNNAKAALLDAGFEVGIDLLIHQQLGTLAVPRPEQKIFLTVDCFKSWGMLAGTEQGKVVRRYFIDCERQAKQARVTVTELLRRIKELEDAQNGSAQPALPAAKLALMAAGGNVVKQDEVLRQEFPDLISNTLSPEVRQANLAEMQRVVARGSRNV